MGLRAWPEKKNVYIRKGAPERQKGLKSIRKGAPERQKRLKRAKTKEQETRTRGPRGKNVKKQRFWEKIVQKHAGPPALGLRAWWEKNLLYKKRGPRETKKT